MISIIVKQPKRSDRGRRSGLSFTAGWLAEVGGGGGRLGCLEARVKRFEKCQSSSSLEFY